MTGRENTKVPDTITDTGKQLLTLLQICDSSFPTGGFSQSYGLETYVQEGLIEDGEIFKKLLTVFINDVLCSGDGLAAALSWQAAKEKDFTALREIDSILSAMKLAVESREGSAKTGRRMSRTAAPLLEDTFFREFMELVSNGHLDGHHAVTFGVLGRRAGLTLDQTVQGYLYNAAAAMVNIGVRLIPLGQQEGQGILRALSPVIIKAASEIPSKTLEDMGSAAFAWEIRAMRHERLYTRLFMS
ncbi:MAG: urease accessory protein UreF [Bacillota bacterium]